MKDYLQNVAMILLLNTCKTLNIDPSGTHITKKPRGQVYDLVRDEDKKAILTITLHKHQVPTYSNFIN